MSIFKVKESRKLGKRELIEARMKAREARQMQLHLEFKARKKLIADQIRLSAGKKEKKPAFRMGWNLRNQTLCDMIEKLDGVTPELKRRLVLLILRG